MKVQTKRVKIKSDQGYIDCPVCKRLGRSSHLLRAGNDTEVSGAILYCSRCKSQIEVNITSEPSGPER